MTVELSEIYLDWARSVVRQFEATRQLVQRAEDSLRFNLRAGSEGAKLDAARSHLEALEEMSRQRRAEIEARFGVAEHPTDERGLGANDKTEPVGTYTIAGMLHVTLAVGSTPSNASGRSVRHVELPTFTGPWTGRALTAESM